MKKLNTYEFYRLGTVLRGFTTWEPKEPVKTAMLYFKCASLRSLLWQFNRESLVSSAGRRTTRALLDELTQAGIPEALPEKIEEWGELPEVSHWRLSDIPSKAKDLETVLQNDLPGLATYYVLQKGLYATDDLISHASHQIPEGLRAQLSEQTIKDIDEAGKCLAFELPTASAFHMWRAVEGVMDSYYHKLTNQSFLTAKITRNWGQYITALRKAGADKKITEVLDMIREKHINPISHPSENVDVDEAFGLFGFGVGVIAQVAKEIKGPLSLPLLESPQEILGSDT